MSKPLASDKEASDKGTSN